MLKSVLRSAGVGLSALLFIPTAHASPITSDMWVYEFTPVTITGPVPTIAVSAETFVPTGTPIPEAILEDETDLSAGGCRTRATATGTHLYECRAIDLADAGIDFTRDVHLYEDSTSLIGFNENGFACTGPLGRYCPRTFDSERITAFDYALGTASVSHYDREFSSGYSMSLSPIGAGWGGELNFGWVNGTWHLGEGGTWGTGFSGDLWLQVNASGRLVSRPEMASVPLPAAGWMLLAALGLLAGIRRRTTTASD